MAGRVEVRAVDQLGSCRQLQTSRNKKQATTSQDHVTSGLGSLCRSKSVLWGGRGHRGKNAGLSSA